MHLPILDNHIHLQPSGRMLDALRDFSRAGGTHAILSHLPYEEVPINAPSDFEDSFQITLDIAEKAGKETNVRVYSAIGPYPVLLLHLHREHGMKKAVEIMMRGMEIAQALVREGKAVAIGEIGRPHFPVDPELLSASNDILAYGMSLAKEAGCPVVLHTESATPEIMEELGRMADRSGLPREKVIKHYCPPLVTEEENRGLFPSVLASKSSIIEAVSKGSRFLMETDFLDDPNRPGAVLSITTVPKRTRALLQSGIMSEDTAWKVHKENPEKIYGITIE